MSGDSQTGFKDHFSQKAKAYSQFRPSYPRELFQWLAKQVPAHERAWDCATGSGQSAQGLAEFFFQVAATDASESQLTHARAHSRVRYSVGTAEKSGLETDSVDMITVAQAVHWFDLTAFYAEARRVARPHGVLALWSYGPHLSGVDAIDTLFKEYGFGIIGPYWPPETKRIQEGYRTLAFPFEELSPPALSLDVNWNLHELEGYLSSWSASQRYFAANGTDPFDLVRERLLAAWGNPDVPRLLRSPLAVRAGRIHKAP